MRNGALGTFFGSSYSDPLLFYAGAETACAEAVGAIEVSSAPHTETCQRKNKRSIAARQSITALSHIVEPKLSQPVSRNTANKDARTGCLQVRRLVLRVPFPKKPSALGGHRPWSFLGSSEVIGFSSSRGSHAVF